MKFSYTKSKKRKFACNWLFLFDFSCTINNSLNRFADAFKTNAKLLKTLFIKTKISQSDS